jgi:hypothetical protein
VGLFLQHFNDMACLSVSVSGSKILKLSSFDSDITSVTINVGKSQEYFLGPLCYS